MASSNGSASNDIQVRVVQTARHINGMTRQFCMVAERRGKEAKAEEYGRGLLRSAGLKQRDRLYIES